MEGALACPASALHFSWWRGGDSSFGSQIASGEDVAVVEQSSSALQQEDDVGEDASEPFLGSGDGAASWVDIEEEPKTMNTDEILEGGGGCVLEHAASAHECDHCDSRPLPEHHRSVVVYNIQMSILFVDRDDQDFDHTLKLIGAAATPTIITES